MTLLTLPLARACAFTEQIICSRQPLPARVLLTPMTKSSVLLAGPPPVPLPEAASSSPPPQAVTAMLRAATRMPIRVHLERLMQSPPLLG